jgi:PAS domain S-box-containing protein
MTTKKRRAGSPAELRQQAEQRLAAHAAGSPIASSDEMMRAAHELQVHQIELEMQNEELIRARAEAELALEAYTDLYDFAPVGYFTLVANGAIAQVNLTGARMLGVERSRLLSRRFAAFVVEADRASVHAMLAQALESHVVQSGVVALAVEAKGPFPVRYLQLTASVAPDARVCHVVAVDITDRRRIEEQVKTVQRLEAIGQLAGGVAHDFNNLLTVILANTEAALAHVDGDSPLRENLLDQRAAAERGAELTRQLLAFSRRQVLQVKVVDVNQLARSVSSMLRRLVGQDIEIMQSFAPNLGRIQVDPTQLDQVLMNLAINARDAMPDGGTLTLSTANVDLDEAGARQLGLEVKPGAFVVVTVSDTGIGMDFTTMSRIFEPFFTTKAMGRGTGLGLSTVYGIVEQCGGDVAVKSELGVGTTFEIYFPRTEAPLTAILPRSTPSEVSLAGNETILIVEDESALRRITERILAEAGYTILSAPNGAEGLRIAGEHSGPIHLALTDVVMPGMTGVAFAERFAQVHPAARVLFMSGHSDGAFDGPRGLDRSTHFLAKPFSSAQLKLKIREVLAAPLQRTA